MQADKGPDVNLYQNYGIRFALLLMRGDRCGLCSRKKGFSIFACQERCLVLRRLNLKPFTAVVLDSYFTPQRRRQNATS